jgi:hypothetical protein
MLVNKPTEPILSDTAISARRQFIRGNFKDTMAPRFISHPRDITFGISSDHAQGPLERHHLLDREYQILHHPNLDIPVGNSYMTLAQ